MANRRRGEVAATLDGRPVTLCLTLGALAELEAAYAVDDLAALADRFAAGRLGARDVARIFACGLRGGGTPVTDDDVLAARIDGGLVAAASVVADLLALTFGVDEAPASGEGADPSRPVPGAVESPSPGTR